MSTYRENVEAIITCLGGPGNITSVSNCMTRLRVVVADEALTDEAALKARADVLGVVHDRRCFYEVVVGPGKSRKYADLCAEMGLARGTGMSVPGISWGRPASVSSSDGPESVSGRPGAPAENLQNNMAGIKSGQKENRVRTALKTVGDIFVPLIPGVIAAGLCSGIASLITQLVPGYADIKVWNIVYNVLSLINTSFMTYITAWAGYRAAERFGATPILGGMLGMITSLDGINTISAQLGMYNTDAPLASVLRSGRGGVLAVIFGVLLLSFVEKKIRAFMPESLDIVFTPVLTLLVCVVPYILVFMPLLGFVSSGLVWVFSQLCFSQSILVRIFAGFAAAALFLPLVAAGMHHGLVALYAVQLESIGYITLYPALAMAGAGQVGAAIAIYVKAKRAGNKKLCSVITGALPAGFLGIGEPLIYGVTLPLGRPFITAGIGAGFGGALVMAMEVAATTWGTSGILGAFAMTAGPAGPARSVAMYLAGLVISYICSGLITYFTFDEKRLISEEQSAAGVRSAAEEGPDTAGRKNTEEKPLLQKQDTAMIQDSGIEKEKPSVPEDAAPEAEYAHRRVVHGERLSLDTDSGLAENPAKGSENEIFAPADGMLVPMKEIPDEEFSGGTMGKCIGIIPEGNNIYAPCSGTVSVVAETRHAVAFTTADGRGILLHAGIDTVNMNGKGFTVSVNPGDAVQAGDKVMEMDAEQVRAAGYSPVIIVADCE